ncbi:aminodeoxychorismate synthase component I [Candidatus Poribacteria bacterium]|nr:aminodeoxychorismate synthase component I [Candidatus Poribacteria bacterium]
MFLIEETTNSLNSFELFARFEADSYSFFLDSGMNYEKLGRYSFMSSEPFLIFRSKGKRAEFISPPNKGRGDFSGRVEQVEGDPFELLRPILERFSCPITPNSPLFPGGAVGYFAYDLGRFIEDLPDTTFDDIQIPDCYFAFYDTVVVIDHILNKTYLCSCGFPESGKKAEQRAKERLQWLQRKISDNYKPKIENKGHESLREKKMARDKRANTPPAPLGKGDGKEGKGQMFSPPVTLLSSDVSLPKKNIIPNFTKDAYIKAIKRAKQYIAAGDIYQVNLSQRFTADLNIHPYDLYTRLRTRNPAPFAAYLSFDDVAIVSSSPERFLQFFADTRMVYTRPIKGTRPRGATPKEDAKLADELVNSEKDRAELIMIVDLERNDLGRVCEIGSVHVPELIVLEKYPTVYHLVSTVAGKLPKNKDRIDLLKATFPGGSITGTPKIRSMEIINELEPTNRSVYTGAIGYLSFTGNMDLNIVIRTFIIHNGKAYFQVGGGIVADSDPEAEYQETLDKARALFDALEALME